MGLADAVPLWYQRYHSGIKGMIGAFECTHLFTGLITTLGFLTAFAIERAGS